MVSTINPTLPAFDTDLLSVEVRDNFAAAATDITALDNAVAALQTKTNISGDGALATNGALTVTALRGQPIAATAPTPGQVLAWSGTQYTPTDPPAGVAAPILLRSSVVDGNAYVEFLAANGNLQFPAALQAGNPIGGVYGGGHTGVGWSDGGQLAIDFYAAGNWTPTSNPTRMVFGTTPINSIQAQPVLSLWNDGGVVIGTPAGGAAGNMGPGTLNVPNGIYINGAAVDPGGAPGTVTQVTAGTGLATTPAGGITGSGSIGLASLWAGGGPFTNATVTVDGYGRVTAASTGSAGVTSLTATAPLSVNASTGAVTVSLTGSVGAGSSSAAATQTGRFFVNLNTAGTIQSSGALAQFTGADSGTDSNTTVAIDAVGTPTLRLRKAQGSIAASSAAGTVSLGNAVQIGQIDVQAYNGVGPAFFATRAQIRVLTTEAWAGSGALGTGMQFWTTPNGSNAPQNRLTIGGLGGVAVGQIATDLGAGTLNAEHLYVMGEDLRQLIQDLADRITALGG